MIKLANTGMGCDYTGGTHSFTYSIENPRDGLTVKAAPTAGWISDVKVNDGTVTFSVSENNGGYTRDARIALSYGSVTAEFTVFQEYTEPMLHLFASSDSFDYKGGTADLVYQVKYPRKGLKPAISCDASWIRLSTTSLNGEDGQLSFEVLQNNDSGEERSAYIVLSYGTQRQSVTIRQTNEQPVIKLEREALFFDYTGGSGSFTFTVENQRDNLTASVRQNEAWITDVSVNNGTVSFSVAENNDGGQRVGEIIITYGSASARFHVVQEYTEMSLILVESSRYVDSNGGSFSFDYIIKNPRKSVKTRVLCDFDWVTDISFREEDYGNQVVGVISYTVTKNNTSGQRNAYIYINCGSVGTAYSIYQD